MAERELLLRIKEQITELKKHALDPQFLARQISGMLNKHFGKGGKFDFESKQQSWQFERIENTHLYVHPEPEFDLHQKTLRLGFLDPSHLNSIVLESDVSVGQSHLGIEDRRQGLNELFELHSSTILNAVSFKKHRLKLSSQTYVNPSLCDMTSTPLAYLKRGSDYVPIEYADITDMIKPNRKPEDQETPKRVRSKSLNDIKSDQKRRLSPDPASGGNPKYIKHSVLVRQTPRMVEIDDALMCTELLRYKLMIRLDACIRHMAVMGSRTGLLLFWNKRLCTLYYKVMTRVGFFEHRARQQMVNSMTTDLQRYMPTPPKPFRRPPSPPKPRRARKPKQVIRPEALGKRRTGRREPRKEGQARVWFLD